MSRFHALALSGSCVDALFNQYVADPAAVPPEWRAAFQLLTEYFPDAREPGTREAGQSRLAALQTLVRRFGHLAATLDPLERDLPAQWAQPTKNFAGQLAALGGGAGESTAGHLLQTYSAHLAVETGHLDNPARAAWIEAHRESAAPHSADIRHRALAATVRAEAFEKFMALRFSGKKRFGAEGAEGVHALIQRIMDRAAEAGVREVIVGTMHRGRLGIMANLFGQPLSQLFARMKGAYPLETSGRAADVPYHLGQMSEYYAPAGVVRIHVLPNPSHLEAINAVALGYARSRQERLGSKTAVLPLILHTDASVVAQGVVGELLQLSELPGHGVGGAINIVINNQIGFTTEPDEGRSSRYCTAPWKMIDSLIAHVNGDDLDAVLSAADLACGYREEFNAESVIDFVCIRANGHNEIDEPRFTQPLYYDLASRRKPLSDRYGELLLSQNAVTDLTEIERAARDYRAELESAYDGADAAAAVTAKISTLPISAAVPASLEVVASLASRIPPGDFNSKAARLVAQRGEEWRTDVGWPTAEILAFGVALSMGWGVRLTGQDVDRGAFSQRHLSLKERGSGKPHLVFETSPDGWGTLRVHNTPLSEYAALAFEYGYSLDATRVLTIWEAQFGDFANGAQTVFDQFIASGAEKWDQLSRLVVLLPHGLEGQGPEHSSGRIERMLHLAARDNLRIAHPSSAANYFHLLLSQLSESRACPLIIFTPKKLLRLKAAFSPRASFETGQFEPILVQPAQDRPRRVLVCSGKIFYDLADALAVQGSTDITCVRLEQLYPFPARELAEVLRLAPGAEVVWVQEEPANFGAWSALREPLESAIAQAGGKITSLRRISRSESPSPAGSFHYDHEIDQKRIVAQAIAVEGADLSRLGKPDVHEPESLKSAI